MTLTNKFDDNMKQNFLKYLTYTLGLTLALSACYDLQEPLLQPRRYLDDPESIFEAFWHGMSRNYVFWGYDTVNWDQTYSTYAKQVKEQENMTDEELLRVMDDMIENLRDHHLVVFAEMDGEDAAIAPAEVVRKIRSTQRLNEDYFEVDMFNRLDAGARKYKGYVYGTLQGRYQYVRTPGFSIYNSIEAGDNPAFFNAMLDFIANPRSNHKGIILDLRHNNGGATVDMQIFAGLFTDKKIVYGATRQKRGNGRHDYGPWIPVHLKPSMRGHNKLPCVVLCDQLTRSMAEATTMALSVLPQVTTVGEATFGAHGPIVLGAENEFVLGGGFELPNGWFVQMAKEVFRFQDGNIYEGIGFPPDVNLRLDFNRLLSTGRDNQLERAIEILSR